MESNTKKRVLEGLWENPERAFGIGFTRSGRTLSSRLSASDSAYREKGKIRLQWYANGEGIMVHYNGDAREHHVSVFDYLQDYHGIGHDFKSTLIELANMYGVELNLSQEDRARIHREQLAQEIFPVLAEALQNHRDGEVYRYLTDVRQINPDKRYFGELTQESFKAAKEALRMKYSISNEDFNALLQPWLKDRWAKQDGLSENGYKLVIPNYTNGSIAGFHLRDITGKQVPKIMCSVGMGKPGYFDKLAIGKPAVLVEGPFDALRLMQAGVTNVIAMTGSGLSEDIAKMLHARDIRGITYVPDAELEKDGSRRTGIADRLMNEVLKMKTDGKPMFGAFRIAEITAAEMNGAAKMDADDYGRMYGDEAVQRLVSGAKTWWAWKIAHLTEESAKMSCEEFQRAFRDVYGRCETFDRAIIKQTVKDREEFARYGITPESLGECDAEDEERVYSDRVKFAVSRFTKDTENGINREAVSRLAEALNDVQAADSRNDWDRQMNQSFDDELEAIRQQPSTLKTKWQLGRVKKKTNKTTKTVTREFLPSGCIELYPADIELFCAFSSHGKTMFLMQTAIDMVKQNPGKTFLYVSCEENKRQLLERAINVFIDIPVTPNGLRPDADERRGEKGYNEYCFLSQTRKKMIKAIIKGDEEIPYYYSEGYYKLQTDTVRTWEARQHYDSLKAQVLPWVDRYGKEIRPFLKFVHTEASAESICANIMHFVSQSAGSGEEIGGIFVDYAQLLTSENKSFNRTNELKDICKALKDLAAAVELPLVIAAQLNRETMKKDVGLDGITMAQIGESADLERIAHDVYLIWQVNKTNVGHYTIYDKKTERLEYDAAKIGERSERIFYHDGDVSRGSCTHYLKTGYMYVESMKARDGETETWALMPFNGERGQIGETDIKCMTDNLDAAKVKTFRIIGGEE